MFGMRCSLLFSCYVKKRVELSSFALIFATVSYLELLLLLFDSSPSQSRVCPSKSYSFSISYILTLLRKNNAFKGYAISSHWMQLRHFRPSSNNAKPFKLYRGSKGLSLQLPLST